MHALPRASTGRRCHRPASRGEVLYRVGIANRKATPPAEADSYRELVLREDNGRAYLHLMRNLIARASQPPTTRRSSTRAMCPIRFR